MKHTLMNSLKKYKELNVQNLSNVQGGSSMANVPSGVGTAGKWCVAHYAEFICYKNGKRIS